MLFEFFIYLFLVLKNKEETC